MLLVQDVPRREEEAVCCQCVPMKVGLTIFIVLYTLEEFFEIPEFIEFKFPVWYQICLGLSLIPGILCVFYGITWMKNDDKDTRQALILAFQLKWIEHAFDSIVRLAYLASLSEDDYLSYLHPAGDSYRHADYNDKYQMSAFFADFIWSLLDLMLIAYMLNVAHLYTTWW